MLCSSKLIPDLASVALRYYSSVKLCSTYNLTMKIACDRNMCSERTIPTKCDTLNISEVEKFGRLASRWWNPDSPVRGLEYMNSLRVPFIRDGLLSNTATRKIKISKPLDGLRILDIGCGGGYLCEPLARTGAAVTGIDPCSESIIAAEEHAGTDSALKGRLTYICSTAEELIGKVEQFDAVVSSEVIEHVDNPEFFVRSCVNLVKENGSLFFTTLNRTVVSYFGAILIGEYVLGIIPKGTHEWKKFIEPRELQNMLENQGCHVQKIHGMLYNPLTKQWSWSGSTSINYALHAVKVSQN